MKNTAIQQQFRKMGFTQKLFAEKHGLSVGTVAGWSNGRNKGGISGRHRRLLRACRVPDRIINDPIYGGNPRRKWPNGKID